VGDYLLGGANPAGDDRKVTASCQRLTVMNRHTGAVLWSATARQGFRNNSICAGGGRCYAIDRPTGEAKSLLKKITEGSKPAGRQRARDGAWAGARAGGRGRARCGAGRRAALGLGAFARAGGQGGGRPLRPR